MIIKRYFATVQSVCLQLQVCGIRVGKLGVEQVIVIQILEHYSAYFGIVPLPGELHHHPLTDMSARQGGLPAAQVSDECQGVWATAEFWHNRDAILAAQGCEGIVVQILPVHVQIEGSETYPALLTIIELLDTAAVDFTKQDDLTVVLLQAV